MFPNCSECLFRSVSRRGKAISSKANPCKDRNQRYFAEMDAVPDIPGAPISFERLCRLMNVYLPNCGKTFLSSLESFQLLFFMKAVATQYSIPIIKVTVTMAKAPSAMRSLVADIFVTSAAIKTWPGLQENASPRIRRRCPIS